MTGTTAAITYTILKPYGMCPWSLGAGLMRGHQKRRAEAKKDRCCTLWRTSSWRAA